MKKIFFLIMAGYCLISGVSIDAARKFIPPIPTAELDQMDYPQLYPTYSWETIPMTEFYMVRVVKVDEPRDKIVRELFNTEAFNRVTDWTPFTEPGEYYWQARVIDKNRNPLSDWSVPKYFTVTMPVKFAVLGDSISHGGAGYIPAGQLSCQWETYSCVPIKNLARSGDTTQGLLTRFDNDVLPFEPKVLVIMAGINDIRLGQTSDAIIKNLETLRDKCLAKNITPVFCTILPMNPEIMGRVGISLADGDWRETRERINLWIKQTPYFIDTATPLTDDFGYLKAELTPDGLHPALRGKKILGELIGDYLKKNF